MRYDAHKQPDPRLNGVHSSSACPPIATVMADVAALTLCANTGNPDAVQNECQRIQAKLAAERLE